MSVLYSIKELLARYFALSMGWRGAKREVSEKEKRKEIGGKKKNYSQMVCTLFQLFPNF